MRYTRSWPCGHELYCFYFPHPRQPEESCALVEQIAPRAEERAPRRHHSFPSPFLAAGVVLSPRTRTGGGQQDADGEYCRGSNMPLDLAKNQAMMRLDGMPTPANPNAGVNAGVIRCQNSRILGKMSSYFRVDIPPVRNTVVFRKIFTRFAERSVRFCGGKFDTAVFKNEVRDFCYNTCPTLPVRVLWAFLFFADLKRLAKLPKHYLKPYICETITGIKSSGVKSATRAFIISSLGTSSHLLSVNTIWIRGSSHILIKVSVGAFSSLSRTHQKSYLFQSFGQELMSHFFVISTRSIIDDGTTWL